MNPAWLGFAVGAVAVFGVTLLFVLGAWLRRRKQ